MPARQLIVYFGPCFLTRTRSFSAFDCFFRYHPRSTSNVSSAARTTMDIRKNSACLSIHVVFDLYSTIVAHQCRSTRTHRPVDRSTSEKYLAKGYHVNKGCNAISFQRFERFSFSPHLNFSDQIAEAHGDPPDDFTNGFSAKYISPFTNRHC